MMVNLHADNAKLRDRAARIVGQIASVDHATAAQALEASDGSVKLATLLASGAASREEANRLLVESRDRLRPALAALRQDPEHSEIRQPKA